MTWAEWFVVGVVSMEWGSAAFYALQHKWPDASMWLCIGGANVAWIWKVLSER